MSKNNDLISNVLRSPYACHICCILWLRFEEKPYRIIISYKRDLMLLLISKERLKVVKIKYPTRLHLQGQFAGVHTATWPLSQRLLSFKACLALPQALEVENPILCLDVFNNFLFEFLFLMKTVGTGLGGGGGHWETCTSPGHDSNSSSSLTEP